MARRSRPSSAALLLDLLELASLGVTARDAAARFGRPARTGLDALVAEGLVTAPDDAARPMFRATPAGIAALRARGRLPDRAAVLFTDVVGSSALLEAHGERGAHARMQHHFSLLEQALQAHRGREIKRLGDGLLAVFSEPAAALACAADMQCRVAADPDRLGLRVGVHAGELLWDGDDVFGTTVVVASRLCDRAGAGEIVASDAAREGRAGGTPLGALELPGVRRPVRAARVSWSHDRTAAPSPTPAPVPASA